MYLVRHAAHDDLGIRLTGRRPGVALNDAGHRQASCLARYFQGRGIDAVQASPRKRTRQTGMAIARATSLEYTIAPELDEIDFGDWTGSSFAELECDAR